MRPRHEVKLHSVPVTVIYSISHKCNIAPKIYDQYMNMWNIHWESRNTRNWSRYETLIYLFEFKVFRHEERETQFLSMLTFPSDPHHVRHPLQSTGLLGELWKSTCFIQRRISTNYFFSNPPNPQRFRAWRHSRPSSHFTSGVFIVTSMIVTSAPRARELLRSMVAPN